ncbi:membrane protein [Mycobacterium avium 11-0986]|nr:membrane protein [Mycobacterium avium 11-0986]
MTQAPQPRVECDPGPQQLPSSPPPNDAVEQDWSTPLIPSIPDATKAAARWIRPLVPPLVARMMDTTTHRLTHPLRTARQVFEGVVEETEEITFALRRTRKVTVNSQATQTASADPTEDTESRTESRAAGPDFVTSTPQQPGPRAHRRMTGRDARSSLPRSSAPDAGKLSVPSAADDRAELTQRDGPAELEPPDGPRQLPPPH